MKKRTTGKVVRGERLCSQNILDRLDEAHEAGLSEQVLSIITFCENFQSRIPQNDNGSFEHHRNFKDLCSIKIVDFNSCREFLNLYTQIFGPCFPKQNFLSFLFSPLALGLFAIVLVLFLSFCNIVVFF